MIQPKHYNYHNRSGLAQRERTTINHFRQEKPLEGVFFTDFIRDVLEKRSRRKSEHYAAVYDADNKAH